MSRYKKVSTTEELWIIFDGGNTDIKAMIHTNFGEEIYLPHAVRKLSEAEFKNLSASYKNRSSDHSKTAIFSRDGQGYIVGEQAVQTGQFQRIVGPGKYTRDHFGAMLAAALIQLYPDGHPDVRLVVLHPPKLEDENRKRLWQALRGKYNITRADGRTRVEYTVNSKITLLEEPVAAMQTFLFTQEGKTYVNNGLHFQTGNQVLILDVGGGLTAFVPCSINGAGDIEVNLSGIPPIDKGIQDVLERLSEELKAVFPKQLGAVTRIPDDMLQNALTTGCISIKGVDYPCTDQIAIAMAAITNPVRDAYHNRFADGINFKAILISGGGAACSTEFLRERVLDHGFVYPVEGNPDMMRYGGIRGASKGLISYINGGRS